MITSRIEYPELSSFNGKPYIRCVQEIRSFLRLQFIAECDEFIITTKHPYVMNICIPKYLFIEENDKWICVLDYYKEYFNWMDQYSFGQLYMSLFISDIGNRPIYIHITKEVALEF